MLDLSQMTGRQLMAKKSQLKNWRKVQERHFESLQVDASHQLADYDAQIREIETEIVRRAMRYEDGVATLPQHMIEAIQRGETDGIRVRTVTELMVEWNRIVESEPLDRMEAFGLIKLISILEEIERRVVEVEDRDADVRQAVMARIFTS